jgi:radical SAM protein with 4Fe4S-binding SPASM domain
MKYIRLHKDCFFRHFENIGYLFQQRETRSLVIDNNGAIFFETLDRSPKEVDIICSSLTIKYKGVSHEQIKKDFIRFMEQFENINMVVMGNTIDEINRKEKAFSYKDFSLNQIKSVNSSKSINAQEESVNSFLQKHFENNPRLMSLQIEITPNCNLKCVHCYLSCGTVYQNNYSQIPTEKILEILDELKANGAIEVTFTGGEAMLNKDLYKLLKKAKENDLSVSILTNAILLDKELLQSIKETNVSLVQVSLYSMTPEVHDSITQVKGSFEKTMDAIEQFIENDIPVQIGCPIMKENLKTFADVVDWGHKHNLGVKINSDITAKADFSNDNLVHRLSIDEAKEAITIAIEHSKIYQERLGKRNTNNEPLRNSNDPICGIGRYMMCLEAGGNYYPCPGFKLILGNAYNNTINEIWQNSIEILKLRKITTSSYKKCMECTVNEYCNICPGKFYNESGGDMFALSDYFCKVAHLNKELAEEFLKK